MSADGPSPSSALPLRWRQRVPRPRPLLAPLSRSPLERFVPLLSAGLLLLLLGALPIGSIGSSLDGQPRTQALHLLWLGVVLCDQAASRRALRESATLGEVAAVNRWDVLALLSALAACAPAAAAVFTSDAPDGGRSAALALLASLLLAAWIAWRAWLRIRLPASRRQAPALGSRLADVFREQPAGPGRAPAPGEAEPQAAGQEPRGVSIALLLLGLTQPALSTVAGSWALVLWASQGIGQLGTERARTLAAFGDAPPRWLLHDAARALLAAVAVGSALLFPGEGPTDRRLVGWLWGGAILALLALDVWLRERGRSPGP